MEFEMDDVPLAQLQDDGLSANECYPQQLVNDPTFAILNSDNYFIRNNRQPYNFMTTPTLQMTQGQNPPFRKRWIATDDQVTVDDDFAWDNGNSSRPLTGQELEHVAEYMAWEKQQDDRHNHVAYVECNGDQCATEMTTLLARYVVPVTFSRDRC